jgi:hypothetical protein
MATKKQKREAGLARREKFEAETKASGLEALRLDREQRERRHQALMTMGKEMNDKMLDTLAKSLCIGKAKPLYIGKAKPLYIGKVEEEL